jgi:hypothetical protein
VDEGHRDASFLAAVIIAESVAQSRVKVLAQRCEDGKNRDSIRNAGREERNTELQLRETEGPRPEPDLSFVRNTSAF